MFMEVLFMDINRIKSLRASRGISQEHLANTLGVKQQTIGKWENGLTVPRLPMLQKIANYFNVTTDYLTGFSDNPHGLPRVEQVEHFDELPLFDEPIPPDKPKDDDFDLLDYGNSNSCYNRSNDLMELGWELSSEEKQVLEAYDLLNEDEKRIVRYILATALERALEQEEEEHQTGA
jgi:transcriptional regulator with XRE-family HTH domain